MAFKRVVSPTIRVEVTVPVPQELGGYKENTYVAIMARPTSPDDMDSVRKKKFVEVCRERMRSWELTDEDTGELVPFSADALEGLLSIEPTAQHTVLAFLEVLSGARAKN